MKTSLAVPLGALIAVTGCGYRVTTYGGPVPADDDEVIEVTDETPSDDDDSSAPVEEQRYMLI